MQDLTALFVTHHHSDHLTGSTDLLFARWLETPYHFVPLPVVAPNGPSTRFLHHMMDPWVDDLDVGHRTSVATTVPTRMFVGSTFSTNPSSCGTTPRRACE